MKRHILTILGLGLLAGTVYGDDQKPPQRAATNSPAAPSTVPARAVSSPKPPEKTDFSKIFKNDKEKLSYGIGMFEASNLKGQIKSADIEVDPEVVLKAFKDAFSGTPVITEAQEREIINELRAELQAKRAEKQKKMTEERQALAEKNKKDGEAFLAANKTKAGVQSFPSGLQYQVVKEGTGETPKAGDTVTANYRGTLIDGTEFDASKPGEPIPFPVTGVIPGWTEALDHMKVGAKWKLFIPSNLAYGERGRPPKIGPNSTLIFDIELVSVKAAPASATTIKPAGVAPVTQTSQPLTSDIIKVPSAEELKKGAKIETIKAEDAAKASAGNN